MVKNEMLASTSILSFLGGEMITVSELGTAFGVVLVELGFNRPYIQQNERFLPFLMTSNTWLV